VCPRLRITGRGLRGRRLDRWLPAPCRPIARQLVISCLRETPSVAARTFASRKSSSGRSNVVLIDAYSHKSINMQLKPSERLGEGASCHYHQSSGTDKVRPVRTSAHPLPHFARRIPHRGNSSRCGVALTRPSGSKRNSNLCQLSFEDRDTVTFVFPARAIACTASRPVKFQPAKLCR
jgi:hypothetical protein